MCVAYKCPKKISFLNKLETISIAIKKDEGNDIYFEDCHEMTHIKTA